MAGTPISANLSDFTYGGAEELIKQEIEHIRKWRNLESDRKLPLKDVLGAGLALSGGGIRSASFSLGVLQALAHANWLPKFQYLSTVSGGGYIGSSLTYLLHRKWDAPPQAQDAAAQRVVFGVSRDQFPYQSFPMVDVPPQSDQAEVDAAHIKGRLLRLLRQNAKYLTPGGGISILSMLGVLLRNSVASLIVHFSLLVLILLGTLFVPPQLSYLGFLRPGPAPHINFALYLVMIAAAIYAVLSFFYAITTRVFDSLVAIDPNLSYRLRRRYEIACTILFAVMFVFFVIGVTPWLYHWLADVERHPMMGDISRLAGAASAIVGLIATLAAHFRSASAQKQAVSSGSLVAVGTVLLLLGLLILAFRTAIIPEHWWVAAGCVITVVVLGWLPDVNYLSLHRFYRDRLMETFMPEVGKVIGRSKELGPGMTAAGNLAQLGAVCGVNSEGLGPAQRAPGNPDNGPYHIINTNVVLVGSETPRYRGRGGDNFMLSPIFWGSTATGWARTDPAYGKGLTLPTAMAISGAAINPDAACGGEGLTRQAGLSALMSILNIRLGYWLPNPRKAVSSLLNKPNLIWPGLAEMFGRIAYLREDRDYVLLSDGGHFENLALYELIRRRMKVIVVCDGGADPDYAFSDLANAIEKVRADFGAIIDINDSDLQPIIPRARPGAPSNPESLAQRVAQRGYLFATIRYAMTERDDVNTRGLFIYMKTAFFESLSADLYGYRNAHPLFPDEPTSDQFFDEKQFEAYRELGYNTARAMMVAASDNKGPDGRVTAEARKALRELGFPTVSAVA